MDFIPKKKKGCKDKGGKGLFTDELSGIEDMIGGLLDGSMMGDVMDGTPKEIMIAKVSKKKKKPEFEEIEETEDSDELEFEKDNDTEDVIESELDPDTVVKKFKEFLQYLSEDEKKELFSGMM